MKFALIHLGIGVLLIVYCSVAYAYFHVNIPTTEFMLMWLLGDVVVLGVFNDRRVGR